MKFKVGDKVKIIYEQNEEDRHLIGMIGKIVSCRTYDLYNVDFGEIIKQENNVINNTTHTFRYSELELVNNGKMKSEEETRYMVYGTGCDNKSELVETEKKCKELAKNYLGSSDWTGRIIGYKLTPIFEAEKKLFFKTIKPIKTKKKR